MFVDRPIITVRRASDDDDAPRFARRLLTSDVRRLFAEKCRGDLVFTGCGSACPQTCDALPADACAAVCMRGCHCPADRPVRHMDRCMLRKDCPGALWNQ